MREPGSKRDSRRAIAFSLRASLVLSRAAVVLLAAGLASIQSAAARDESALRAVTGNDYKPFSDQALPKGGLATEIVRQAFARQGVSLDVDWLAWDVGYERTDRGEYDLAFPWAIDAARRQQFYFSEPIYTLARRLFGKKGANAPPADLSALEEGSTVCLPSAYALPDGLAVLIDGGRVRREEPLDMTRCFELLALDRVDWVVVNELQGWDLVRETPGLDAETMVLSSFAVQQVTLHAIAPRSQGAKSEEILATFNAGLAALEADGAYDELLIAFLGSETAGRGAEGGGIQGDGASSAMAGRSVELEMRDGSKLLGEVRRLQRGAFVLATPYGVIEAPTADVAGLRFTDEGDRPAIEIALADDLARNAAPRELRLAGSNVVGARLIPALIEAWAREEGASPPEWSLGSAERVARFESRPGFLERATVVSEDTAFGFRALEAEQADIAMASRPIVESERERLAKWGDLTEERAEHVLALDGVAILVHPDNPIEALSRAQLAEIWSGRITDWSELGGPAGSIEALGREEGSGTRALFESLIGARGEAAEVVESGSALAAQVASRPGAIGYADLGRSENAKAISIDECGALHAPDAFAVKAEDYPFERRLYLYNPPETDNRFAAEFLSFAESENGQAVAREEGFVDLGIVTRDDAARAAALAELERRAPISAEVGEAYRALAREASRVSSTFRFRSGSARLDPRAERDVRRVAAWARANQIDPRDLVLAGFADGRGDYATNRRLSQRRAEALAEALALEGIEVGAVFGFGEEYPIACDVDQRGWALNRRVELWLRGS